MSELNSISNSFSQTLKDSDLQSITVDLVETLSDTLLEDGVFKDIPVISTIIGIGKVGMRIRDRLFLKKIMFFLSELKDIPSEKREAIINEIDSSEAYRTKVGEKLLYIIEKCDDHEKSQIMGKLFKAFLKEIIDYDSFLRCSIIIQRAMIEDIEWFVDHNWEELNIEESADYLNWGVVEILPFSIDLKERRNFDFREDQEKYYELVGGELKTRMTFIGKKLREALKN